MMYHHSIDELMMDISNKDITNIESLLDEYIAKENVENDFYVENKKEIIKNIKIALNISTDEYKKEILYERFVDELDGQISNIYTSDSNYSKVRLQIKDKIIAIDLKNNIIINVENGANIFSRAVYVDEPYIMDDMLVYGRIDHRTEMKKIMHDSFTKDIGNNLVLKERLTNIIKILSKACNGRIIRKNNRLYYSDINTTGDVAVRNMSTGLKSVSILRELLEREIIQSKGVLILDEPEVHLHPQWQLIFAETLVLLQKEFELHILLNTHSPYFINAIETFSKKHNIENVCKYYLPQGTDNDIMFKDVTNDRAGIYDLLAEPFQTLENEEYGE